LIAEEEFSSNWSNEAFTQQYCQQRGIPQLNPLESRRQQQHTHPSHQFGTTSTTRNSNSNRIFAKHTPINPHTHQSMAPAIPFKDPSSSSQSDLNLPPYPILQLPPSSQQQQSQPQQPPSSTMSFADEFLARENNNTQNLHNKSTAEFFCDGLGDAEALFWSQVEPSSWNWDIVFKAPPKLENVTITSEMIAASKERMALLLKHLQHQQQ
jgi:hypothetical protein